LSFRPTPIIMIPLPTQPNLAQSDKLKLQDSNG
jgi:hypothetical protein